MAAATAIKVENPRNLSDPTTKDAAANILVASPESGADKSTGKFEEAGAKTSELYGGAAVTDIEKKMKRAERFGVSVKLTEQEKRNTRAERFGTGTPVNGSDSSKKSEELKRKARAERFGGAVQTASADEEAKKKARLARFGSISKPDPVEEDKKKARAIRFSKESGSSSNEKGAKDNEEAVVTGEAGVGT